MDVLNSLLSSASGIVSKFLGALPAPTEEQLRLIVALSGPALALLGHLLRRQSQSASSPVVENICIYPIKSCRGLELHTAQVDECGLKFDRMFILMTPSRTSGNSVYNMLSQRNCPRMAQISFGFSGSYLVALHPGMKPLCLGRFPELREMLNDEDNIDICTPEEVFGKKAVVAATKREGGGLVSEDDMVQVQVWGDTLNARLISQEHNEWFSSALGREILFGKKDANDPRFVQYKTVQELGVPQKVAFQDGFPILIFSSSSMYDVNNRIYKAQSGFVGAPLAGNSASEKPAGENGPESKFEPLSIMRIRPNIILGNTPPFDEDTWRDFSIGNIAFKVVKPCDRCSMPGVHPQTGDRSRSAELMTVLKSFRERDGRIFMGQNVISLANEGLISVGDQITVGSRAYDGAANLC